MNSLKICFIGIGSIARRHIRNLKTVCDKKGINLEIDALRHSKQNNEVDRIQTIYYDLKDLPDDYDAVFVTNPTELHIEALEKVHNKGRHFFIEKPVVSMNQIKKAMDFPLRKESVYYVACPLRYNAVIQYIKQNIRVDDVISVRSISSSYLPDWRPGQDYRTTYSAHKDMGGGVSIDLIHEWDYLTYLFGWPEKVLHLIGKKSDLEIDSDDYAVYLAEYKDKIMELHLDYFGRKTIREVQLITKDDTIVGDLVNNTLTFLREDKTIDFREERDDFQKREIEHFLNMIMGHSEKEEGFRHGIQVLNLTQGII
ncbi:MAG: Gfo/Idh/MocA family oxidoreductase [Parasporobacterium sp.]|nr:Gfo/Idh/MocA family oxidoreductase [Parasporobacterium sp.]